MPWIHSYHSSYHWYNLSSFATIFKDDFMRAFAVDITSSVPHGSGRTLQIGRYSLADRGSWLCGRRCRYTCLNIEVVWFPLGFCVVVLVEFLLICVMFLVGICDCDSVILHISCFLYWIYAKNIKCNYNNILYTFCKFLVKNLEKMIKI